MCYTLTFPSLPSLCHAAPRHLVNLTMYFICDEITNNPQWGMTHCKAEDCIPYGVFGSYRSKGECPHCIEEVVGERVLFVMESGDYQVASGGESKGSENGQEDGLFEQGHGDSGQGSWIFF
ncbi:uncharacterized protein ACHE_51018S [Aspergillus chevalieri]|uniref:Uncharacterized protein n=1 Tax=Aspergillus chevalieri TaxID=182096 RepID=A0A7R7VS57_ASPCH|nr:uncharacterized protein ACHE_51018S [Aspergillus chevalieri]BCR89820.1 hypothetical protein ACHE_51018S [Aspergillus chevalieri]